MNALGSVFFYLKSAFHVCSRMFINPFHLSRFFGDIIACFLKGIGF